MIFIASLLLLQQIKANGNIAFAYQPFYTLVLINELDLDQNTTSTNNSYTQVTKTNNQVTSDPSTFLKNNLNKS